MKSKQSLSLDADLVEAAEAIRDKVNAPISATINRWAQLGKQVEEAQQPKPKIK